MKKTLIYLLVFLTIFGLDFFIMLWNLSNFNLMIVTSCVVNFILYRFISKNLGLNKFLLPIIVTILSYIVLGIWYLLTYKCINCLDIFFIKLFLPIPIFSCLLIFIYQMVGKCFYAVKNKRQNI